jgi:DNA polymerase
MVVLDNPGAREDREGNPFVCGTRQTLHTAAQAAGLGLNDMYVTWVLKCRPTRAYDKPAARAACLPYLQQQLEAGAARVMVLMGNVALQAVLQDPTLEVKALRGQVLTHTGRPTICSYHPLAARRRPNLLAYLEEDLHLAAQVAFES